MPAVERYSVVRLLRPTDGKGVADKEYLIISMDPYPTVLFPGPPTSNGVEDGWTLGGTGGCRDAVQSIGLSVTEHSGWNISAGTYEYVSTPADPAAWFRSAFLGIEPEPFAVGSRVIHEEIAGDAVIVYASETRVIVHAPPGSIAGRERGGWRLNGGTNLSREERAQVQANVERLGIDATGQQDGFWWLRKELCTQTTTVIEPQPGPGSGVFVAQHTESCSHERNFEHILIEANGYQYMLEPTGHAPEATVSAAMRAMGIDPHSNVTIVREWAMSGRRELTVPEARTAFTSLHNTPASRYALQSGSIALPDGTVQWVGLVQDVAIYHHTRAPEGASHIEQYSNVRDALASAGLSIDDYRQVNGQIVRWRYPTFQWAPVLDTMLGDDPASRARRAIVNADIERERYVEVLHAGANRLGIIEDLPGFIEKVDLGPLTEFTVDAPLTGIPDMFLRSKVSAPTRESAIRMAPTQTRRGECTIYTSRNINTSGTPIVR